MSMLHDVHARPASGRGTLLTFCLVRTTGTLRALVTALLLSAAVPVCAQTATGDILGTVRDSTGAVVPGASVRAEDVGTHAVRTFSSNATGEYVFTALQPGTYSVTVTSPAFKTFNTTNVVLLASDRIRVDAALTPGAVSESVEVTATPSALQTDSTTVGSTITEKTLVDAPLNGRNYIGLVQVQAGVTAGSPTSLSSGSQNSDRRLNSSVSANGQQEIYNNNQVDGLDNNSRTFGAPMLRPSVEAIAEVRTNINLYTAEVGRTGGAAINVITKSGANGFHGSAYEFFRNDITDARNFFAPASLLPHKPELRQNQFGGSLSGPIVKDKTFFFLDYEGLRRIDGTNSVYLSTVPTAYEDAHPGSVADIAPFVPDVPTAAIDPTALGYFRLFPAPNTNLLGTSNNFLYNPSASFYSSTADIRIDHHFSASDTLFGRYSYNKSNAFTPPLLPSVNGVAAGGSLQPVPGYSNTLVHNGAFGYTHVFTPSLLLELRAGYTFFNLYAPGLNDGKNLNDSAPYRIPNANECLNCSGLAGVNVLGYALLGDPVVTPQSNLEHTTQFAGAMTYTHGRQTFKAGASLIRRNFTFFTPVAPKGLFTFPGPSPQIALHNFFAGAPYVSIRQAYLSKPYDRTWEPSVFFQDDWHPTSRLTFNFGLRYDVFSKPNEKNNNYANYDLSSFSLIDSANGGIQNQYKDVSPRFGFDATIGRGLVLRGGAGLAFYVGESNNNLVLNNPPFGFNTGAVVNFTPISTTGVAPVAITSTANANLSGTVISRPLHEADSYLEQFNLVLQKEFGGTVLTAGYVAELGRHIQDQIPNLDLPAPTGPVAAGTAPPPLVYLAKLPKVTTINYFGDFGVSSYNSLQVTVERRISHGLTANVNYTYAHNLDDVIEIFDGDGLASPFALLPSQVKTYDYGNSPLDIRNRLAGFFSYDLPFGKTGSSLYKAIAGGFRFNGVGYWQSGSPFTVISTVTQTCPATNPFCANSGLATINLPTVTADKPNVVGSVARTGSGLNGSTFFNLNSFAQQALGTPGSERRNQLFGPHRRDGDLSLFKTVPLKEGVQLELRAECFNFTNTPNFSQPNATISSYNSSTTSISAGGFGTITSTIFGTSARQYQFAARFSF